LDIVNSLLNNGECLHLFTNDEMDGLYSAIVPSLKREYPNMILDPKKFFNARVKKNLHICLSLSPNSEMFQTILKNYSKMINCCQIYWIKGN
jgi:dynein heavy chain